MSSRAPIPHLLRVDRTMLEFAAFVAALRQDGRRAGWLEWAPGKRPPSPASPEVGEAGVLRAVKVDAERTVAIKQLRGAPVLRDVLREHFRGCAVVLVRSEIESESEIGAPLLEPADGGTGAAGWRIVLHGAVREMNTEALVAALRRPHPFPAPASPASPASSSSPASSPTSPSSPSSEE